MPLRTNTRNPRLRYANWTKLPGLRQSIAARRR